MHLENHLDNLQGFGASSGRKCFVFESNLSLRKIQINFEHCEAHLQYLEGLISEHQIAFQAGHQWSSGRIVPCHGTDPGSIPG